MMTTQTILDLIEENHEVIRRHQSLFDSTMIELKKEKNIFSKNHKRLWLQLNYHFEISKRLITENELLFKEIEV